MPIECLCDICTLVPTSNHHYGATLLGSGSSMKRVPYDPHCPWKATNCSASLLTPEPGFDRIAVEHTPSPNGLPTNLWCGYSNGMQLFGRTQD